MARKWAYVALCISLAAVQVQVQVADAEHGDDYDRTDRDGVFLGLVLLGFAAAGCALVSNEHFREQAVFNGAAGCCCLVGACVLAGCYFGVVVPETDHVDRTFADSCVTTALDVEQCVLQHRYRDVPTPNPFVQ